jgi:DNA-binding MarR family transcriptional regulator
MKLLALPCYCATLRQAARAVTALYEETMADAGIPITQYTALQVMKVSPSLTTTEIADLIGIDQTTATRTLALIKKSGMAVDMPGSDRRERRWSLTTAGEAAMRKLNLRWEAAQETFEARLGKTEAASLKKAAYVAARKLAERTA